MAHGVSESLGGVFPDKVDATLEFRACRVTVVHPCRDENIYSNSRVHSNRTLSDVSGSNIYELRTDMDIIQKCYFSLDCFLAGVVEKGSRELLLLLLHMLTLYHYLMQPYKLCLFLISC